MERGLLVSFGAEGGYMSIGKGVFLLLFQVYISIIKETKRWKRKWKN